MKQHSRGGRVTRWQRKPYQLPDHPVLFSRDSLHASQLSAAPVARQERFGLEVPCAGCPETPRMSPSEKDDRVKQFKEYVQALNKQFLEWATKQWERSPTRFWSTGMQVRKALKGRMDRAVAPIG